LVTTLVAAFVLGAMVFIRQYLLDRELAQLLAYSQGSFDNLKRLQAQILQSEKLASLGQLVGGAAHELNNPIAAMLGYSDLLLSTELTPEQQVLAAKIGKDVRRTKSLVASLLSFARQTPAAKTPVDLNTLARTAIKLMQTQWEAQRIHVQMEFDPHLPKVLGDSNQLLQVFLQLLGHSVHEVGAANTVLTARTERSAENCVLLIGISPTPLGALDPSNESLGLSACRGILQEHGGHISHGLTGDGSLCVRVVLPVVETPAVTPSQSTVPVLWQSRPFA